MDFHLVSWLSCMMTMKSWLPFDQLAEINGDHVLGEFPLDHMG